MDEIQTSIYKKAKLFQEEKTTEVKDWDEFKDVLENKGGFISTYWDGTPETEEKIKAETKATIRCITLDSEKDTGTDVHSGKPAKFKVIYAKSY